MKVAYDFNLEAWMRDVVIEGYSKEECFEKLRKMSISDMLDAEGCEADLDISDIAVEVIERDVKLKITNIDYDIIEDDVEGTGKTVEEVKASLPQEIIGWAENVTGDADMDEVACDVVTFKTDYLVNSCSYEIIEER